MKFQLEENHNITEILLNLDLGQKRQKNRVIKHKMEIRAVRAIFQMREEGLSLRAIAKCLNEMKIPTKCRGKSWHPEIA